MDVVYASLRRREPGPVPAREASEVVGILWAHALPGDALQHITARSQDDRIDLLLYLLTRHPDDGPSTSVDTAHTLLTRGHRNSPLLNRRYHAPAPDAR
ncbi:hypothetical protein [Kitasatospora phosalacinea]|uniref:hypothetical protein n=1 Tax=Kitasatospora phosalacinea TaxID=2065 RepID=UPI0005253805|nr:hypothetical protein [Kitasatospora phosalacinea]